MLERSSRLNMSYRAVSCLMLVLAACGVPQEIFDTRVRELDRCHTDLNRVQGDYASTQKNADELAGERSELRDRITTLESDRMRLSTNLSVQKQNAELFKNAVTMADRRAELYKLIASKLQPLVDTKQVTLDTGKSRLFIGMPDATLFEPGRADLKPDGEKLLRELAGTMKQVNRDFLVACHSDNQPLPKTSLFKSGWELTLARSIAIVRFFQGEGVDPRHLGAAGYSEFNFIADNSDEAGRAQNRRVELIVMPNADELLPLPPELDTHHKDASTPVAAPTSSRAQ
jgi:chemotaxis protein MotB